MTDDSGHFTQPELALMPVVTRKDHGQMLIKSAQHSLDFNYAVKKMGFFSEEKIHLFYRIICQHSTQRGGNIMTYAYLSTEHSRG